MAIETGSSTAELARTLMDAVSRQDLATMEAMYSPDVVDDFVPIGAYEGREALLGFFVEWFTAFPDFEAEVVDLVADGDTATVQWHGTGTFKGGPFLGKHPTGRRVELRGCDVMRFKDGRLQRNTIYFDAMTFARQIGLLPREGSAGDKVLQAAFNARTDVLGWLRRQARRRAR